MAMGRTLGAVVKVLLESALCHMSCLGLSPVSASALAHAESSRRWAPWEAQLNFLAPASTWLADCGGHFRYDQQVGHLSLSCTHT